MRVFAFNRITGNWDAWTYNVGQNMYLYFQPGERAKLIPGTLISSSGLGKAPIQLVVAISAAIARTPLAIDSMTNPRSDAPSGGPLRTPSWSPAFRRVSAPDQRSLRRPEE